MASPKLRHRSRACKNCGNTFTYAVGPGKDRSHCTVECREVYRASRLAPKSQWPICSTPECQATVRARTAKKCNSCYSLAAKRAAGICGVAKCKRPATRTGPGLCELHYYRVRRNSSPHLTPRIEQQTSAGYVMRKAEGHPMSGKNGWAFEHRLVAYEQYGEGPHPCHWCGTVLDWRDIVVDHLNERKDDNTPSNVVVACNPCNRIRGAMIPFISRMQPHRIAELIATFDHMRSSYQCVAAE